MILSVQAARLSEIEAFAHERSRAMALGCPISNVGFQDSSVSRTAGMRRKAAVRVVENVRRLRVRLSRSPPVFAAPRQVHHAQHRRKYCKSSEWGERR